MALMSYLCTKQLSPEADYDEMLLISAFSGDGQRVCVVRLL
jgi:hypothetical protein